MNWSTLQEPDIVVRLILQICLLASSAIFSMSETALFSLREIDLQKLAIRHKVKSERLRALLDEPRQLIVSILCGNELINIAATINLAGIMLVLFESSQAAALANMLVMVPLLLILCEITPKTLAVSAPVTISTRLIEPLITTWVWLVWPLRVLVMALKGCVPESGDEVVDAGMVFRVLDMKNLLIDRVLVAPQGHPILSQSEEAA